MRVAKFVFATVPSHENDPLAPHQDLATASSKRLHANLLTNWRVKLITPWNLQPNYDKKMGVLNVEKDPLKLVSGRLKRTPCS
jgi:hypothetical protein